MKTFIYLLSFMWQVLAVAQGSMSVVTDKRGHFRQGLFVLVPKYATPAS
jgi:hypothetical protein